MSTNKMNITYGTESGNSEMAADDISAYLEGVGCESRIIPMEEFDFLDMFDTNRLIVITSTYGEGDLPETAAPFYEVLTTHKPDLSSLEFAAFGLGDSTYETYGNGIDTVAKKLIELGAKQIGETGRHDAAKGQALTDVTLTWMESVLPLFENN